MLSQFKNKLKHNHLVLIKLLVEIYLLPLDKVTSNAKTWTFRLNNLERLNITSINTPSTFTWGIIPQRVRWGKWHKLTVFKLNHHHVLHVYKYINALNWTSIAIFHRGITISPTVYKGLRKPTTRSISFTMITHTPAQ